MREKTSIDLPELRRILHYNKKTGEFTNRITRHSRAVAGTVAGAYKTGGYLQIQILNSVYLSHRLAWFYVYGEWPVGQIDHINGTRDDNRLCNLRVVTPQQNKQNQRKAQANNKSGFLGVTKVVKKWRANIGIGDAKVHLGYFSSPEKAHAAYVKAKRENHETCSI